MRVGKGVELKRFEAFLGQTDTNLRPAWPDIIYVYLLDLMMGLKSANL